MTIKASQLIGKDVIAVDNGEKIEKVDDILYSPSEHRVTGILVKSKGLFSNAKVVSVNDVQAFGEDAVMVANKDVVKAADEISEQVASLATSNDYLTQTQIVTEDGKELGKITDIYFDSQSGRVEEFAVSQGALKNVQSGIKHIKVEDIITVGKDATVVRASTAQELEDQAKVQGVQGAMSKAQEKGHEYTGKAQQKFADIKQDPKTQEFIDNVKGAIDMLVHDARVAADNIAAKARNVGDDPRAKQAVADIKKTAKNAADSIEKKARDIQRDPDTKKAMREFKDTSGKMVREVENKIQTEIGYTGVIGGQSVRSKAGRNQAVTVDDEAGTVTTMPEEEIKSK